MSDILRCCKAVLNIKFAELVAYRSHFILSVFLLLLGDLMLPLVTLLVYNSGASFPGWTLHEAMLIQAIFVLSKGIAFPFFFGLVGTTLNHVRAGSFDLLLLKPRPALFMSLLNSFDIDELGRVVSGAVLLSFALSGIDDPLASSWVKFSLLLIASIAILFAMTLFLSALLFKWVGSSRVFDIFDTLTRFGMYPGTIFSKQLQNLLTYILPISLIAFVPASALLGREGWGALWALLSAGVLVCIAIVFWNRMQRNYTSAGG